eukprot:2693473-Amphidinium_carterae.2
MPATKKVAVEMPLVRAVPSKGQVGFTAADGSSAVWSDMSLPWPHAQGQSKYSRRVCDARPKIK